MCVVGSLVCVKCMYVYIYRLNLCVVSDHVLVCEYYAHVDCQDFSVNDCKECATYVPPKDSDADLKQAVRSLKNKVTLADNLKISIIKVG